MTNNPKLKTMHSKNNTNLGRYRTFDYTTITDQLILDNSSDNSHPTGGVNPRWVKPSHYPQRLSDQKDIQTNSHLRWRGKKYLSTTTRCNGYYYKNYQVAYTRAVCYVSYKSSCFQIFKR